MSRVRTQSATRWTTAHRLLALAGVRDARVHDGRHTAATVLIELGVHVRIVQEILSHSDIRRTQRYTHVASPIAVDAAQQMGGALGQYAVRVTELQPGWLPGSRSNRVCAGQRVFLVEPPVGIEPTTFSLRVGPTAYDWASTSAFAYCSRRITREFPPPCRGFRTTVGTTPRGLPGVLHRLIAAHSPQCSARRLTTGDPS